MRSLDGLIWKDYQKRWSLRAYTVEDVRISGSPENAGYEKVSGSVDLIQSSATLTCLNLAVNDLSPMESHLSVVGWMSTPSWRKPSKLSSILCFDADPIDGRCKVVGQDSYPTGERCKRRQILLWEIPDPLVVRREQRQPMRWRIERGMQLAHKHCAKKHGACTCVSKRAGKLTNECKFTIKSVQWISGPDKITANYERFCPLTKSPFLAMSISVSYHKT